MDAVKLYRGVALTLLGIVGFVTSMTYVTVQRNNDTVTELTTIVSMMRKDVADLQEAYSEVKADYSYQRGRNDEREKRHMKEIGELRDSYPIMDSAEVKIHLACEQMEIVDKLLARK